MAAPAESGAMMELPAALVEQLLDIGLRSPAGQIVLTTILNLHPDVRAAIVAQKGDYHVTAGPATLAAGKSAPA